MQFGFNTTTIALVVLLQSTVANAEAVRENRCVRDGVVRTVELQADNESGAPCRVLYHKPMEDQSTTNLWNARNDAQFCSTQYDAFMVKLETRLNWSCTETADISDSNPNPGSGENLSTEASADTSNRILENAAASTPSDSPVKRQRPVPERAIPDPISTQHAEFALSMQQIEYYIPSGNYVSYKEKSHSDNSPLCPVDGFFTWNTQFPDKPVFQMGADHEFQFDLTSLTDSSVPLVSKGVVPKQCQPTISAGYCSNDKYSGDTPLHPVLSSYFGCDGSSSTSTQKHRPLVLVRTLIDSSSGTSECDIPDDYQYLALSPSASSSEFVESTETHDIELVILPRRTNSNSMDLIKGYVCRYVRES